jgi:hypothetical protein
VNEKRVNLISFIQNRYPVRGFKLLKFWGKKSQAMPNEEIEKEEGESLLAMRVVGSFSLLPSVTVRTVCFDSSQKVYEFENLMVELFTKIGTKICGFDELETVKANILKAVKTNPALSKGTSHISQAVGNPKDNYSMSEMVTVAKQLKAKDLMPNEVVFLPITGASIDTKKFQIEETFKLIQVLGDLDWQNGLPSVIVAITDRDHGFSNRLKAQKMAQFHALFFGY